MKKTFIIILGVLLLLAPVFASGSKEGNTDSIPTIKWVQVGGGMPANYKEWKEHVNKYLEEKLGIHIDVEVVGWGEYDSRYSVIVNTNEPYDIIFTNNKSFSNSVGIGAFLPLDDLLEKDAKELYSFIPKDYWKAVQVNGKIYGVPAYKDSSLTNYLVWDKSYVDKYNIDYKNNTDFKTLTPVLEKIHKDTGANPYILASDAPYPVNYDFSGVGFRALGVEIHDKDRKAVAIYEQEDILQYLEVLHDWYKRGIINSDAATLPQAPHYRILKVAQGWPSAVDSVWGPQMGVDAVAAQWGETILSNDTVRGSIASISANSKHPELALKFLQLLNTDTYLRDAFAYGLEGDNFSYTEDKRVHKNNADWKMAAYAQGTFFTMSVTDDVDVNPWKEVKELNEQATPSVMLGFTMDISPVEDEIANCANILQKYELQLITGASEPRALVKSMMKEMRAAGFDKVQAELQKQIDKAF